MDLDTLRDLLARHKNLINDIEREFLEKMSCTYEKNVVHIQHTNNNQSDKSDTSRAAPNCFQESSSGVHVAQNQTKQPTVSFNSHQEQQILETGLQHITLKQALNAASERFRSFIPMFSRAMSWNDLVEAAYAIKGELHISQHSWSKACDRLGRNGAAICVLLTDQGIFREENCVMKPAAYFNGMIAKFEVGELHLHNSIFGLLTTENA